MKHTEKTCIAWTNRVANIWNVLTWITNTSRKKCSWISLVAEMQNDDHNIWVELYECASSTQSKCWYAVNKCLLLCRRDKYLRRQTRAVFSPHQQLASSQGVNGNKVTLNTTLNTHPGQFISKRSVSPLQTKKNEPCRCSTSLISHQTVWGKK